MFIITILVVLIELRKSLIHPRNQWMHHYSFIVSSQFIILRTFPPCYPMMMCSHISHLFQKPQSLNPFCWPSI